MYKSCRQQILTFGVLEYAECILKNVGLPSVIYPVSLKFERNRNKHYSVKGDAYFLENEMRGWAQMILKANVIFLLYHNNVVVHVDVFVIY